MKVTYHFVTGNVEIEVADEWGRELTEMDRLEYNNNQKETRRHVSLDTRSEEGKWLADNGELFEVLERKEVMGCVRGAVSQLKLQQQAMVKALYLANKPVSQAQYARLIGVSVEAVKQRAKYVRKKLREIIEKSDT